MDSKLEQLWRSAAMEYPVCILNNVKKADVLFAISQGADTPEKLKQALPLCKHNECAAHSPLNRGCKESTETLLEIYAPVWTMMKECHCKR